MQMSYGTSIKMESIVDLEKTLSLPQIWKLKFTLCVSKSKDKKEGKCNFKRENNVNICSAKREFHYLCELPSF